MLRKVSAILKLTRFEHGIMVSLAILVGALVAKGMKINEEELLRIVKGMVKGLLVEMGIVGFNDYTNMEEDKINSPDRPLVRGELSKEEALIFSSTILGIGMLLPWCTSPVLPLGSTILLYLIITLDMAYNVVLKKYGPIGNFAVSLSTAAPFVYGALLIVRLDNVPLYLWIFFLIAFLATFSREIVKDIRDVPGDSKAGLLTLPHIIGVKKCFTIAYCLMGSAILLSLIVIPLIKNKMVYLAVISITNLTLLYSLISLRKAKGWKDKKVLDRFRKISLIGMGLGIISFLASSF